MLLAKVWDKINAGLRRNIIANTCFLSPRELEMTRFLFGDLPGLHSFGGYEEAERKMLVYLPDYLEEDALYAEDSPVVCLRASFFQEDSLSHRDFLGALMARVSAGKPLAISVLPRAAVISSLQRKSPPTLSKASLPPAEPICIWSGSL